MVLTTLFDDNIFGSDTQFDTVNRHSINIVETEANLDSAIFGDSDQFDTTRGGVITIDDTISRIQNLKANISESESISDSISRLMNTFRN